MAYDWKNVARSIAWSIAVVICCAAVVGSQYGTRVTNYYLARRLSRNAPQLAVVPIALSDYTVNSARGMTFSRYGYQFEIPWKDVSRIDEGEKVTRIVFNSGIVLVFFNPKSAPDRVKAMHEGAATLAKNDADLRLSEGFGADTMASNYALMKAILTATPSDVSVLMSNNDSVRNLILLKLKKSEILAPEPGLFSVDNRSLHGFQQGQPAKNTWLIVLSLFDTQDREFDFYLAKDKGLEAEIGQGDVNRIVQTLRPVEE